MAESGKSDLNSFSLIKRDRFADHFLDLLEIDLVICWQHRHQVLIARFYHHHFRLMPSFDVLGLGDPLRRHRLGVVQDFVLHVVLI